jgi:SAM-dependent methyltransferase
MSPNKMDKMIVGKQVISKKRVADHGEVFTRQREVNAMLDLVKQETERIDSRFLEPACGTGNFLAEVLTRKLRVVESRYKKSQLEYERNAVLAVSSIYGIDILQDNVAKCRECLFGLFDESYTHLYKTAAKNQCRNAVQYILEKNVIHGDALTLKTVGDNQQPIVFAEWSFPFNNSMIKRCDYTFSDLLPPDEKSVPDMFSELELVSDTGKKAFIPKQIRSNIPVHFTRLPDANK